MREAGKGSRGGKSKEGGELHVEEGEGGGHHLVVTVNRLGLNLLSHVFCLNIRKSFLA